MADSGYEMFKKKTLFEFGVCRVLQIQLQMERNERSPDESDISQKSAGENVFSGSNSVMWCANSCEAEWHSLSLASRRHNLLEFSITGCSIAGRTCTYRKGYYAPIFSFLCLRSTS